MMVDGAPVLQDMATFYAMIIEVPGNQFQAICLMEVKFEGHHRRESPMFDSFNDKREAQAWVRQQAAAKGIESVKWINEFSANAA